MAVALTATAALALGTTPALAHDSLITLGGVPVDPIAIDCNVTTTADVVATGTISHAPSPPGANVAGMPACLKVDGLAGEGCWAGGCTCDTAPTFSGPPPTSRPYTVVVPVPLGVHTLQASTFKPSATPPPGHRSWSPQVEVQVVCNPTACDEQDPPAYANHYLNGFDTILSPSDWSRLRGQIIRRIAINHADGVYGTCTYNYDCVEAHVDILIGDPEAPLAACGGN